MKTLRELFSLLLNTGLQLIKMPKAWTAQQWTGRLGLLALIVFAALEKRPIQAAIQGHAPPPLAALAAFLNVYADGDFMIAYVAAIFLFAWAVRAVKLRETAEVFLAGGVFCFLIWCLGKFIFAERRPIEGGALLFFTGDGHGVSGHASVAALLILPIREVLLRDQKSAARFAGTAAAILWVALVCWSRVFLGKHFVWNVLSGLAVGLFCSAAAVAAFHELKNRIGRTQTTSDRLQN